MKTQLVIFGQIIQWDHITKGFIIGFTVTESNDKEFFGYSH